MEDYLALRPGISALKSGPGLLPGAEMLRRGPLKCNAFFAEFVAQAWPQRGGREGNALAIFREGPARLPFPPKNCNGAALECG
jgi:hypothetical protein